ncbi:MULTISPECIES: hypothetical protein [Arcobacteraceae]|uniref:hypothetical protein n=1 Tax=Arcobacteraceae TaxID=2808963 RepID=UPI000DE899F2|nr:hypothetical protein [Arcobacter sp. CECT 9188]RBQ27533.1 hypothetical protein CRU88_02355 [Arcobacter sp. CECT 9188]
MGLKIYIVATILFLIVTFGYTYSLELGEYTISLFGNSFTFPVAVWIIFPALILVLATYLHIIFYSLVKYIKEKFVEADLDTVIDILKSKLLGRDKKAVFKTKKFKDIAELFDAFDLSVTNESFTSTNLDFNKIVNAIQDINSGKYVSEKVVKLEPNSDIAKKNLINKINEQVDFAIDILKKSDNYDFDIIKLAFKNVIKEKSMTTVKKLYKNIKLDKDLAFDLLSKDIENKEFGFSDEEIIEIVKNIGFTKDDYIKLAQLYKKELNPDRLINVFEKLSNEFDEATTANLYILSELEMIDKLRETLANSSEQDFLAFKALLDLKDAGKYYNLETLSYK